MKSRYYQEGISLEHKVHVRIKLSALWTSIMLCYIYGDYFALYSPGVLDKMASNMTPFGETTPMLILFFAISMAIPASMISASVLLKRRLSRWLNIIIGVLYSLIVLLTVFSPGPWSWYYKLLGSIEILFSLLIVVYAFQWKTSVN